jgi:hypothetical protein
MGVFHQPGIAVSQALGLLAQNLLRWFRRQLLGHPALATAGRLARVRRAANSRAVRVDQGRQFSAGRPWPGLALRRRPTFGSHLWGLVLEEHALPRPRPN